MTRHKLLDIIDNELGGAHTAEDFKVLNHTYRLRSLDPEDEEWADANVKGDNFYQTARSRRAPYVAAALVAMDGVPVEKIFTPPADMPELQRKMYDEEPKFRKMWIAEQVLAWLMNPKKHGPFVQELYGHYLTLEEKRVEALRKLDPLLAKTRTGGSSDTSSPEKESSSPTPASNE